MLCLQSPLLSLSDPSQDTITLALHISPVGSQGEQEMSQVNQIRRRLHLKIPSGDQFYWCFALLWNISEGQCWNSDPSQQGQLDTAGSEEGNGGEHQFQHHSPGNLGWTRRNQGSGLPLLKFQKLLFSSLQIQEKVLISPVTALVLLLLFACIQHNDEEPNPSSLCSG